MGNVRRRFKAVLFDLYDTLIWLDSERSANWRRQLAAAAGVDLDRFSVAWRRTVNDRMLGKGSGLAGHLSEALSELGVPHDAELVAKLVSIERRRLEECVHLYPSTIPVLRELSLRGYKLGLISNISDGASVPITYLGLDLCFDDMILSHEVGILKPDPAIFVLACDRFDVAPAKTIFVADGGFGELDASRGLGIYSVLVEQEHQSRDYGASQEYDLKIHDLAELLAILPGADRDD
ncbi:MAG TPA: HAD family hydrolase [Chloroflexota bacterium]|nr:HAD family hydrolase [Chloroflexota bacterium]